MPTELKKGWTRVAFGAMVEHIAERAEPMPEDGDKYVGLEHLDSGSLTVQRWGTRVALIGTKLRMRQGDILFARRNAYLRRVAIAPHDGLFSAHGMVVRARPSVVLREFLPFFMQSDVFMDRAEHISVGSLSPTINWTTLAKEEFDLPPVDEQQRIAKVLKTADIYRLEVDRALVCLQSAKSATEAEVIGAPLGLNRQALHLRDAVPCDGWRVCTGQELLDKGYLLALQDGNHGSQYPRSSELGDEGMPYIAASDISDDGDINLAACRRIRPERAGQLRIPPARSGDVILTNNATVGRVTRLPDWPTDIVASTSTTYYRCNGALLDPDFLRWFLESAVFQFQLASIMRQSTRNQVPITTQKRLFFAIPPVEVQKALAAQRTLFLTAGLELRRHVVRISQMKKTLMGGIQ